MNIKTQIEKRKSEKKEFMTLLDLHPGLKTSNDLHCKEKHIPFLNFGKNFQQMVQKKVQLQCIHKHNKIMSLVQNNHFVYSCVFHPEKDASQAAGQNHIFQCFRIFVHQL